MSRARGSDFSSWQPVDEVARIAPSISFAFVKATEGLDYLNPLFAQQVHELHRHGVHVGYYHFLDPAADAVAQWDHFEQSIAGKVRAPVALDYEAKGATDAQAKAFIRRGRQRGYRVGLYGSETVCKRRLGQAWRWVAKWSDKPPVSRWDVWQFTNGHGRQDYNVYAGDLHHLRAWWQRQSDPLRRKVRPRWWLTDLDHSNAPQGPLWLVQVGARLLAYARAHPGSHLYTLERK